MKKISTFAAAAALAVSFAAPAVAQDANADPFVSTQGAMAVSPALVAAGLAVGIIAIAAIDSSDDT
ncbi:hypothetical protein [Roseovarius nanhaiticus]|uniref:Ferrochelatase n=1 Tax=Roseovarius nanhaiticus TaxID=573024 RepID=A0A1N7HKN8_9RHOB|nr:hypothetical protein [Roseovarius nanhaiticus]SEL26368.1 hypothetical protein SAMN05216208_3258 [Roseovarius nanhaiticus]SIS25445.1 hypothetical protein SAMN05421666_3282 [Roseovarius nanhaiticus]